MRIRAILGTVAVSAAIGTGSGPAWGQERPPRVETAPVVDGVVDEVVWDAALAVEDFVQRNPVEGAPPTEPTRVRMVYTRDALYLAVEAFDSEPSSIVATVMKRDDFAVVRNDQFAIAIDSYADGRNGYWFSTNPLGVRVDAQFFDEGEIWQSDWDGAWRVEARVHDEGWTAEIEIPFSTMRFEAAPEVVMGINLFRRLVRTNETLFAPLIPLQYACGSCNVSIARLYVFEGIAGARSDVTVEPFVVGGIERDDSIAGSGDDDSTLDAGFDVRYGISDNLRLTLSYDTDFAQAEVDDRQINLSRFSLFFPEKRDFFLEDSGTFSFGEPAETEIFFSRRVGLARGPEGALRSVPILAGGKLTGRVGGTELGVMNVRTGDSPLADPTNYGVARAKLGLGERSYVGGVVTSVTGSGVDDEHVLGLDGRGFVVGDIGVRGFGAVLRSGPAADAAHAYAVAVFRDGERLAFDAEMATVGRDFAPAAGFVVRRDVRKWRLAVSAPSYRDAGRVRRVVPRAGAVVYDDLSGGIQTSVVEAGLGVDLFSDDALAVFARRSTEDVAADFSILPGVTVPAGGYEWVEAEARVATKSGRSLSGAVSARGGGYFGGHRVGVTAEATWKASRHLTVSQFYASDDVRLPGGAFRTHLSRTRVDWSLDTHLSLAGLAQYDNASDELGIHLRLDYLVREGTEVFLVWNEVVEEPGPGVVSGLGRRRVLLLKLTHRIDW